MYYANISFPDYTNSCFSDAKITEKKEMLKNYREWSKLFPKNETIKYLATDDKEGALPGYMSKGFLNKFDVTKMIHSPFAEINYQLAQNLVGNLGLKVDKVDMTIDHRVSHVAPGSETIDKLYFLPSMNLKYDLNAKNSLRLGLSKTYTLPQSKEISPYQYVNISFSSQGNAKLKPSDNYNADLKWDYYLSASELISLTGFYKYIVNPIARVDIGNSAGLLTYQNVSDMAMAAGGEFELSKNLFDFSGNSSEKINRLSVGLNVSYIHTALTVDYIDFAGQAKSRTTSLEGGAPIIMNFDISHNLSINERSFVNSLVFNYFSDRVHTIGALGFKDIIEQGVPTLAFVSSSKISKNLTLKLKANNILNPAFKLTRENTDASQNIVLNEFRKGMDISFGLSYEL